MKVAVRGKCESENVAAEGSWERRGDIHVENDMSHPASQSGILLGKRVSEKTSDTRASVFKTTGRTKPGTAKA